MVNVAANIANSFGIYKKNSRILKYYIQENLIFAANFLDKPKTKAVNNGLIGLVI